MSLGVTRGDRVDLLKLSAFVLSRIPTGFTYTEVLEVIKADSVAEQVQKSILEHATVSVAVNLIRILSVNVRADRRGKATKGSESH